MSGRIPSALSRLTNLRTLGLGNTALRGRVPPDLGRLTRLRHLDLRSWGLSGPLPARLRRPGLQSLSIFGSQTCAPTSWRNWVRTIEFDGALCGTSPDATIDVLVVYTPTVTRHFGGVKEVEATIDLLIAEANGAFRASGVRPRVALAGRSEVRYTETGSSPLDLRRLADPSDGHMDRVHAVRRRTGADLVHLLVRNPDSLGVAVQSGDFSLSLAGSSLAFVHELGHNMGLQHDRYEVQRQRMYGDLHPAPSYGYVNQRALRASAPKSRRWRTIMAYDRQCQDSDFSCTPLMRFSNPRQRLRGDPLGVPFGSGPWGVTGPSDATAWLNLGGRAVAARRER